jgi:hypothetical protein
MLPLEGVLRPLEHFSKGSQGIYQWGFLRLFYKYLCNILILCRFFGNEKSSILSRSWVVPALTYHGIWG